MPKNLPLLISIILLSLSSTSCHRSTSKPLPKPEMPPLEVRVGEGAMEQLSPEEMKKFQPDVNLSARFENGALSVTVLNHSQKTIKISAANFGILSGHNVIPPDPKTSVFPPSALAPEAGATGKLRFPDQGNLIGRYFVFSHPDVRSSRCSIRGPLPAIPKSDN
jgi:hypothetical protein